ncbi:hypothetical protein SAMN02927924_04820 [Sphingobium faniae]|nr:hypothetical protein SAMN02927924_04820 [Sphingobium faniae]
MNESHECGDGFLAAQRDPSEAFEFVEEAFDLMALLIESPVDRWLFGAAGIGLDMSVRAEAIGNDVAAALQTRQEGFGLWGVAILPRCRMYP